MKELITEIIPGKDLTKSDLEIINNFRKIAFNSDTVINPQKGDDDWNKLYFLLKRSGELLAFGRLHEISVNFIDKTFSIFGIATIVSILRGKGYGKALVKEMRAYIETTGKTGVGFCNKNTSDFYRKCGLNIMENGQDRFRYITAPKYDVGDAIYINGKDNFINKMIEYPDNAVMIPRPHW